jgi:precorrin-6Y C5,15-methyltransferase (decarboxylating)
VFVGGGGLDVVRAVAARRPARLVVALATVERVGPVVNALSDYRTDAVLLESSRLQPLGDGHRLVPTNPVFVVSGVLA